MGELAASIAHEVNQPLTAVTNNGSACLRLLANRNLEPEVLRRALEEIIADGTRASAVIARIRAFIKKAPAEKSELDINEVIQEVLALAGRELHKNQVSVECQLTKTLPLVLADRVQLQQVLLNLIMNGIEAMAGGHRSTSLTRGAIPDRRIWRRTGCSTRLGHRPWFGSRSFFHSVLYNESKRYGNGFVDQPLTR